MKTICVRMKTICVKCRHCEKVDGGNPTELGHRCQRPVREWVTGEVRKLGAWCITENPYGSCPSFEAIEEDVNEQTVVGWPAKAAEEPEALNSYVTLEEAEDYLATRKAAQELAEAILDDLATGPTP